MNIARIDSPAGLARAERERERFLNAATYVRLNPAPAGIDPLLWQAQAEGCEFLAEEIADAIHAYRQRVARSA